MTRERRATSPPPGRCALPLPTRRNPSPRLSRERLPLDSIVDAKPNLPGRPGALTATVEAQVVAALRAGCSRREAAFRASISPSSLNRWSAAGRRHPGSRFGRLLAAMIAAEAQAAADKMAALRA